MNLTRHVSHDLAAYHDGQLPPARMKAVEAHLTRCDACRLAHQELVHGAFLLGHLAAVQPPPSLWTSIDAALATTVARRPWHHDLQRAAAWILVTGAAAAGLWWFVFFPAAGEWRVMRAGETVTMVEGDRIVTGSGTAARIDVADIGTVDVAANTEVRLGRTRPGEHRLALERGSIAARIAAPPRVFFVETPASTVVDLGCAYTVDVDEEGTGILRVTEGWAALEWNGRESLVPAGAHNRIQAGVGPGTPYFEDASPAFVNALAEVDFGRTGREALETVLREARARDTLTLWHLLPRVRTDERPAVYDRMAALVPPPADLNRDRIMALDPVALRYWREELAWKW